MYRTDTDTGLATPDQVALIITDQRAHWDQNADDSRHRDGRSSRGRAAADPHLRAAPSSVLTSGPR
ncbi:MULTISPECIES: hypothetical protein [unclassified Rathayibacter]|uniref:hypothetical protein n=1 Tax=unclassified Rathayibacter TaxID=2609250 RepID=UPI000CE86A45|nr:MULTISPECIES: hypothetical protein [unclassified Rathayibacter]PPF26900.1 hypothetical protein C5C54_11805 [Rathayibacter sp. AY1F2]PPH21476.1 hypothetical protein C5C99_06020 [Rathayibacter sp. AY1C4]PPH45125.1 hypothetical protein C5C42_09845 [Rathayibacter sp. AY1F7]PPH83446.1 hypothetical protein C5C50_05260 [Rathayibacter sp. AY1D9]